MLLQSFWKKVFILNIVLLLVIYRLYTVLEKFLRKNTHYNTLFTPITDNGYPFFSSINCDISALIPINNKIINENIKRTDNNIFPNNLLTSRECSFMNKYTLCKNNKECLYELNNNFQNNINNKINNSLYHNKIKDNKINNIIGIPSFFKIINEKNQFMDKNTKIEIEIQFYNKIISGYYSFLYISQYDNIKNSSNDDYYNYNILKQITQYEDRLNDLFYLHSLILKTFLKMNSITTGQNETQFDTNDLISYADQCIQSSDDNFEFTKDKIIPHSKKIFEKILLKDIKELIHCFYDINEINSFNIDLTALNTMVKILFDNNKIVQFEKYEYNSVEIFLKKLSTYINDIFKAEIEVKNKINLLRNNYVYLLIIFVGFALAFIFFINKHILKNKKNSGNNKFKNEIGGGKNNEKKITKEELDYINKLSKDNKADFLITK
jgi:hypothetical protein